MFFKAQKTAIIGSVAAALAIGGFALYSTFAPHVVMPVSTPPADPTAQPEPPRPDRTEAEPRGPADPTQTSDVADAPAVPPSFDVVRVAADGGTLVAGSAMPGSTVILRIDGRQVGEAVADAAGQFVLFLTLDPATDPQTMTLESRGADGQVVTAPDTVVLAPRPPVALAAATEGDPEPDAATHTLPTLPELAGAQPAVAESATVRRDSSPGAVDDPAAAPLEPATTEGDPEVPGGLPAQDRTAPGLALLPPAAPTPPAPDLAAPERGPAPAALPATPPDAPDPAAETLPDATSGRDTTRASAAPLARPIRPAEPTALLPPAFVLRDSGAVEISGPAPQPADAVVIDAISYSDEGAVQISGRAGQDDPQARVQLYLDNQPLALAQADRGVWSIAVPALEPGLYTLRADQLGADGRVVTRFETPFQRAALDDIARPPSRPGSEGAARAQIITVQPGNSLWRISRDHYGEGVRYVQIYQANVDQIRDPDLIYPGQIFVLPD